MLKYIFIIMPPSSLNVVVGSIVEEVGGIVQDMASSRLRHCEQSLFWTLRMRTGEAISNNHLITLVVLPFRTVAVCPGVTRRAAAGEGVDPVLALTPVKTPGRIYNLSLRLAISKGTHSSPLVYTYSPHFGHGGSWQSSYLNWHRSPW